MWRCYRVASVDVENCQTPWRIDCISWNFKSLARTRGGALHHQLIRISASVQSVEGSRVLCPKAYATNVLESLCTNKTNDSGSARPRCVKTTDGMVTREAGATGTDSEFEHVIHRT